MSRAASGPSSRLLTTYRILAKPFEWMPKWQRRYGDPMRLPAMNGDVYLTGNPELIKQIFAGAPHGYRPFASEAVTGFAGPGSMLVISGERHARERKLLSPPFRGSQLKALGPAMAVAAKRGLDAATTVGTVRMADVARSISLEAIIRTVFGVQDEPRVQAFISAIVRYLELSNPIFFFATAAQNRLFPPWRAFLKAFAHLDALLQSQIDGVRGASEVDHILASMLAARYDDGSSMTDEDIKSELRTLLFAGHDTTAITLAWAVDHIHRDATLLAELRRHVDDLEDSVDAYVGSELLEHVWKEALRMHPVITEVMRTIDAPMKLGDVVVPEGAAVSASISLVHNDPALYPRPEVFDPHRFATRRYANHEYLPFGGGHRRCLGAAFAGHQLQIVLGVLLRRYAVQLLEARPPAVVRSNVTLAPKGGVPVIITAR